MYFLAKCYWGFVFFFKKHIAHVVEVGHFQILFLLFCNERALHSAALAVGERPLDWKPDVCWQLPLRLHEDVDAHGHVTSTLREWKRRDWGEGGAEFHWWCTESHDAFGAKQRTYQYLRDEIVEFTGVKVYDMLVKQLEQARATPLPHPAVRRR